MKPFAFIKRRPVTTLLFLVAALAIGGVFALYAMRVDIPALNTKKLYASIDSASLRVKQTVEARMAAKEEAEAGEGGGEEERKIVVTSPVVKDVTTTQEYVCQIHSQKHIEVRALEGGYLEKILIREGQAVKKGDLMFKILPVLFQARLDAKVAEAKLAELEYNYSKELLNQHVVSANEVLLKQAKLAQASAEAELVKAELEFTNVKAPFDGIVDRLYEQIGSLIAEGDMLTTLSDNSVMWVYFNVPEADYLEYMEFQGKREEDERIELRLAGGSIFDQTGEIGAIEAKFNNETGNIAFRADFPNPDGLLRHGQTGTVLIHHTLKDGIVIPQRAKYEILAKQYVYVVSDEDEVEDKEKSAGDDDHGPGKGEAVAADDHGPGDDDGDDDDDHRAVVVHKVSDAPSVGEARTGHGVVHQREIVIQKEQEDIYVIKEGLEVGDKIILEGIRQVRDGDKVEYEYLDPEEALGHLKYHAE